MTIQLTDHDDVSHPVHYLSGKAKCSACDKTIECIDVTRDMGFNLGNAIKYIWRSEHKGNRLQDLKKARWYLDDAIKHIEKLIEDIKE